MERYATISADIVASTSLPLSEFKRLRLSIIELLVWLEGKYEGFWGRLVKGDSIECVMRNPKDALRVALLLKSRIISFVSFGDECNAGLKDFGLRMVVGIGEMEAIDKDADMMAGPAIYLSGRALADMRKRRTNFLQIQLDQNGVNKSFMPSSMALLNQLFKMSTRRQCETLFYRLQCDRDLDVARKMDISRAGVSNNLHNMGWDAIKVALIEYENLLSLELDKKEKEEKLQQIEKAALAKHIDPRQLVEHLTLLKEEKEVLREKLGSRQNEDVFGKLGKIKISRALYEKVLADRRKSGQSGVLLYDVRGVLEIDGNEEFSVLVKEIDDNQVQGEGHRVTTGITTRQNRPNRVRAYFEGGSEKVSAVLENFIESSRVCLFAEKKRFYITNGMKKYSNLVNVHEMHTMAGIDPKNLNKKIDVYAFKLIKKEFNSLKSLFSPMELYGLSTGMAQKEMLQNSVQKNNIDKKLKIKRQIRKVTPKSQITINKKRQQKRRPKSIIACQNHGRMAKVGSIP